MNANLKAVLLSVVSLAVYAACVFGPAGTFDYWQGWVFLGVMVLCTGVAAIWMGKSSPEVLQRRMTGGPTAEDRPVQKLAVSVLLLSFTALVIISAFDYRFGWSTVPTPVVVLGDVLVAAGLITAIAVVVQNNYAAAKITVESGQPIVSTGLYGIVRHPMYTGSIVMMIGIPLALASYWGLLGMPTAVLALAVRILDEEKMLRHDLAGYDQYTEKVRYRLVPYLW